MRQKNKRGRTFFVTFSLTDKRNTATNSPFHLTTTGNNRTTALYFKSRFAFLLVL